MNYFITKQGLQCDWPDCGDVQPISDNEHCCPYCPSGKIV